MSKTIWKYSISLDNLLNDGEAKITTKLGGNILKVELTANVLDIWILVDPTQHDNNIFIKIFGTGHKINNENDLAKTYIDTVFDGNFVWHLFQRF